MDIFVTSDAVEAGARALLERAGLGRLRALERLPGGANNRVFRAEGEAGVGLLKAYFRHPTDPRDRLAAEFGFFTFAQAAGVSAVPRPLAKDDERGLGLYEFVEGRPCREAKVDEDAVRQAAALFRDLNRRRGEAGDLGNASDACFSLADHAGLVERRLAPLEALPDASGLDRRARGFARGELRPAWEAVLAAMRREAQGPGWEAPIGPAERCVSPSDFGFHNALRERSGRLRFLDFEYAGWDDPAKMLGDFFGQVAAPVPTSLLGLFFKEALADFDGPSLRRRAGWALRIHRFKWTCLVLGEFLPDVRERRRFASGEDPQARRSLQLEKARLALGRAQEQIPWPI